MRGVNWKGGTGVNLCSSASGSEVSCLTSLITWRPEREPWAAAEMTKIVHSIAARQNTALNDREILRFIAKLQRGIYELPPK
jgi:hypothetical protein